MKVGRPRGARSPLQIVHVVVGEGQKDLIGPQVVDPLEFQAASLGSTDPAERLVLLIEGARHALGSPMKAQVALLRRRAAGGRVVAYPIVGRLGVRGNAVLLARWLRTQAPRGPQIFHCRGENAVEWAAALSAWFPQAGIVADIRGAWPEEALHARGYDGPDAAPPSEVRRYHVHLSRLQAALACAGSVLTVSHGMRDWLAKLGTPRHAVGYVPCAVSRLRFDPSLRETLRKQLGFDGKLVYAYVGILASYHSIDDGLIRFFRATSQRYPDAHLLALTPEVQQLRMRLEAAGVSPDRTTIMHAAADEVGRLLTAADCGLILMQRCRLAPTWQPIKFAEYLASGLPVVVSRGVGQVDTITERAKAGVVVDVFDDDASFERSVDQTHTALGGRAEELRANARLLCEREFLWSRYVETWGLAYERARAWQAASPSPLHVRFGT